MSAQLDILLADQRRLDDQPRPTLKPLTRADHIKATGDGRRVEYRKLNPNADAAMVYGCQVGYLHGEIVRLCNELESFNISRDPVLSYHEVYCTELDADVIVGFNYEPGSPARVTSAQYFETTGDPGDPGESAELEVMEVWCNGVDIAAVLLERVAEQLTEAALSAVHAQQAQSRDSADDEARAEVWA